MEKCPESNGHPIILNNENKSKQEKIMKSIILPPVRVWKDERGEIHLAVEAQGITRINNNEGSARRHESLFKLLEKILDNQSSKAA